MARAGGILCGGWASRPRRGVLVASLLSKGDGGSKAIYGTGKVNWLLRDPLRRLTMSCRVIKRCSVYSGASFGCAYKENIFGIEAKGSCPMKRCHARIQGFMAPYESN